MPDVNNPSNSDTGEDDGYLHACEGILRTHFGRRHFDVTAKAMEDLRRVEQNARTRPAAETLSNGREILAILKGRWLSWATAFAFLLAAAATLFLLKSSANRDRSMASLLKGAQQFVNAKKNSEIAIKSGYTALERREYDRAESFFTNALRSAPLETSALYGLAQAQLARGKLSEAEQGFRSVIRLDPKHAATYDGLAFLLKEKGDLAEAEKFGRKSVELNSREAGAYITLASILVEQQGGLSEAETLYRKVLQLAPNSADAFSGLAQVRLRLRDPVQAETLLRKAISLSPGSPRFHNNLGEALRLRGQIDEAEQEYREALRLDPEQLSAYGNLAIVYADRRNFSAAETMCREVLKRANGSARLPALVNLAIACGEQNKNIEAEQQFREALALAPDEPRVTEPFAAFLADHELKLDEALALAQRAVARSPNADTLDTLGWVQLKKGALTEARRALEQALSMAGEQPVAAKIREHLKQLTHTQTEPPK
jgi:Flp pilus assembly protein TadD